MRENAFNIPCPVKDSHNKQRLFCRPIKKQILIKTTDSPYPEVLKAGMRGVVEPTDVRLGSQKHKRLPRGWNESTRRIRAPLTEIQRRLNQILLSRSLYNDSSCHEAPSRLGPCSATS